MLALAGTGYGISQAVQSPPSSGTANLWVNAPDTPGYSAAGSCTRSATAAYNAATACSSAQAWSQANLAAQLGDTVYVRAGTYAAQTVAYDASKTSTACDGYVDEYSPFPAPITTDCVHFQPAPGETSQIRWTPVLHGGLPGPIHSLTMQSEDDWFDGFDFGQNYSNGGGVVFDGCVNLASHPGGYDIVSNVKVGQGTLHFSGPVTHDAFLSSIVNLHNDSPQVSIATATSAKPAVFTTSSASGLATGDHVIIRNMPTGWTSVNTGWVVTAVSTTQFKICSEANSSCNSTNFLDASSFPAYTGGGTENVQSTGNGQYNNCGGTTSAAGDHIRVSGNLLENVEETTQHHVDILHVTNAGAAAAATANATFFVFSNNECLNFTEDCVEIQVGGQTGTKVLTATSANPAVFTTSAATGAVNGQPIYIYNMPAGWTTVNNAWTATVIDSTHFEISPIGGGALLDASSFPAYTGSPASATPNPGGHNSDITIENNISPVPCSDPATNSTTAPATSPNGGLCLIRVPIVLGSSYPNDLSHPCYERWLLRNNTLEGGGGWDYNTPGACLAGGVNTRPASNIYWYGDVTGTQQFDAFHCGIWPGAAVPQYTQFNNGGVGTCGTTNTYTATDPVIDPTSPAYNMHINCSSAAVSLLPASYAPFVSPGYTATDYAAATRPNPSHPTTVDAGAYENC